MFRKFEKITVQWIALFTFRTTYPWLLIMAHAHTNVVLAIFYFHMLQSK